MSPRVSSDTGDSTARGLETAEEMLQRDRLPTEGGDRLMLDYLFVGLGSTGQRHLRNLRTLVGQHAAIGAYRVRGERHLIDDRLQVVPGADVVERHGVRVFADLDAALSEQPRVVFVTNPTSMHVEVALRAAGAGCDLFIEKPLSHDFGGVRELVNVARERDIVAGVAHQLRFHPGFVRMRELLADEVLGPLYFVRAEVGEYLPGFHPYEDYRRMYASRAELGGGVTLTQIHEIDYLYALFGMPERVFSIGHKVSRLEIDVEDVAASLLEYRRADGTALSVELHQDYLQRPARRGCVVVGEAGRIEWSLAAHSVVRTGADGEVIEAHDFTGLSRNQLFLDELAHFLDCVRSRRQPEVTLEDGAASLAVALALRDSQQSGAPVKLEGSGRWMRGEPRGRPGAPTVASQGGLEREARAS